VAKQQPNPPTVYVIAGPNGAGKTTFASEFLPDFVKCREFLNADLIAAGLSPFAPEAQNVRAGRLLLERIRELAGERVDFGFETTLSGRTYVKLLTGDSWSSNRLSSSGGSKHKRRRFMKKATDDPLTKLADAAFRQAARKVIKRAKEAGTTVVVWEDGEIKEVDPRTIKIGRRKKSHEEAATLIGGSHDDYSPALRRPLRRSRCEPRGNRP
jgi:hypothetical protein